MVQLQVFEISWLTKEMGGKHFTFHRIQCGRFI